MKLEIPSFNQKRMTSLHLIVKIQRNYERIGEVIAPDIRILVSNALGLLYVSLK
jgi:hypothetical protein